MEAEAFEAELRKQLVYWQKALYLQDWTVDLRIVKQYEMGDFNTLAQCQWFIQRKDAIIQVLAPDELPGVSRRFINNEECDYDISLVHELLHLHFASFHRDEDEVGHEQAINAISRGIVKVWREENKEAHTTLCHKDHVKTEGYL